MKIEFNDPDRLFGTDEEAIAKVVAALKAISGIREIKIGNRTVTDAFLEINITKDYTSISIRSKKGTVCYYARGFEIDEFYNIYNFKIIYHEV